MVLLVTQSWGGGGLKTLFLSTSITFKYGGGGGAGGRAPPPPAPLPPRAKRSGIMFLSIFPANYATTKPKVGLIIASHRESGFECDL